MAMAAPLGLTMGEPAGIGGDISLMAWTARQGRHVPPFVMLDDPQRLSALAEQLGMVVPVQVVSESDLSSVPVIFERALPVLPVPLSHPVMAGRPDSANASAVIASIDQAVALSRRGLLSGLVTNPIQKSALYATGFRWPGHTEYLAHLAGLPDDGTVMLLEGGGLRVVLATIHLALKDVAGNLSADAILHVARVTDAALRRDFGIARPRLAVAALNPHAGEGGAMGREEIEIISPAVAQLQTDGIDAKGPFPSDTLFHAGARAAYDAVVCMYHDQGLIPLKTLDFDQGVNITLGLPFIRTSPDHGTALSLAGTGRASPTSLIAALHAAQSIASRRLGLSRD